MEKTLLNTLPPEQIVLLSLLATIGIGTALLSLPAAQIQPIPLIDLFFTATSATCVTGLFTIPLDHFTFFGKAVILGLVQIGGLGLITMTLVLLALFMQFNMETQLMAGQILEINSWRQIRRILATIVIVTLLSELVGTLLISNAINLQHLEHPWFTALFHSISSFCNAGFTIFSGGELDAYRTNNLMLCTTMTLMFIGGLGFITWHEIGKYLYARYQGRLYRFSLHSKIILYGSTALIICSSIIFWILEHKHLLAGLTTSQTIINSFFYSLSFRSAGFLLSDIASFTQATLLFVMILSFIGSSPGSTGSGVKITTFTLFLATLKAAIQGKTTVTLRGRSLALGQIYRSIGIVSLGAIWIIITVFCLLITQPSTFSFFDIVLESVSAFTCVGVSTGITPALTSIGKLFIMISMMIGRIGSFTLILAVKLRKTPETEFTYPEERVMLG